MFLVVTIAMVAVVKVTAVADVKTVVVETALQTALMGAPEDVDSDAIVDAQKTVIVHAV